MIAEKVRHLLALPRPEQVDAARALIASLPPARPEAWNTTFGPGSLFEAWTATRIARDVHGALAEAVAPIVAREGFTLVDVGGGDGSVWRRLPADAEGTLVVVDPLIEAVDRVRSVVPAGVTVEGLQGFVQDVELPACDALVCSMTLHHLAGADASDRAAHGLTGPGKREVLERFGAALRPGGRGFLVEADVDCDIDLEPGDPTLADNIFDSYVRRCGAALLADLDHAPEALRTRWEHLLRFWFLEQLGVADVPLADRDVYELTIPRWKALLDAAGLELVEHRGVDSWKLFQLYVFQPR